MKILITNFHLIYLSGLDLFTADLAEELKKAGHDVYIFVREMGFMAEKVKKSGIPITDKLEDFKNINFDVIHAHHNITAILVRAAFPEVPMIFMAHGILPQLDNPPEIDIGIDKYVAASRGVAKHLTKNHGVPSDKIEIVGNFIDFKKFFSKKEPAIIPKKLLFLSNHNDKNVIKVIKNSCRELRIEYIKVGLLDNPRENVEDYINEADIVVTLGRGALEAMACERNVIVYDMNGGDGIVTPENFFELSDKNFSGTIFRYQYDKKLFVVELKKYNRGNGRILRNYVKKNYNSSLVISKLEKIYEDSLSYGITSAQRSGKIKNKRFLKLVKEANKNYLLKINCIQMKEIPALSFHIIKKYGILAFLHKTINFCKLKSGTKKFKVF